MSTEHTAVEYRVRWRREGRQRTTRIYQTRQAAECKARGILALEDVKASTGTQHDLTAPPEPVPLPVATVLLPGPPETRARLKSPRRRRPRSRRRRSGTPILSNPLKGLLGPKGLR